MLRLLHKQLVNRDSGSGASDSLCHSNATLHLLSNKSEHLLLIHQLISLEIIKLESLTHAAIS